MPRKSSRRTNDAGQPPRYTPLPADGEWTRDSTWAEVTSLLADPTLANRALSALRKVFPPEHVQAFEGEQLHPLECDYLQRATRIDLVELGLALADLNPKRVIARLRNPLEYRTTRAELQTGLMLQRMGAEVEHEPTGGTKGPDWLASWPDPGSATSSRRRIGVEVKCLATSHDAEALMLVDFYFGQAFMMGMQGVRPSEAAWLTTRLNRDLVDELVFARKPQRARIAMLGSEAAQHAQRALPAPTRAGTFSMGRGDI